MGHQYIKFFINGSILGLLAWALQILIFRAIALDSAYAYALASALAYPPLVIVNFMIQRSWIFNRSGLFLRFVAVNMANMLLVSLLSPLCRQMIDIVMGAPWGDHGGFAAAALLGSIPSFFIKRHWVFGKSFHEQ